MTPGSHSLRLREQLEPICQAVSVNTTHYHEPQLCFADEAVVCADHDTFSTAMERIEEDPLTLALRNLLYQRCYAVAFYHGTSAWGTPSDRHHRSGSGHQPPTQRPESNRKTTEALADGYSPAHVDAPAEPNIGVHDDVTAQLSAANTGKAGWELGWVVESISAEGCFTVTKNGQRQQLWPGEFISAQGMGQPAHVGSEISIHRPSEATQWQPGFYHAFSDTYSPDLATADLVRFYWNVRVDEAAPLMNAITTEFNRYQIPFRFKCTNLRSLSNRIDTAVLYVSVENFRLCLQIVLDVHKQIRHTLDADVPLFAYPLATGLAFAQNPPGNTSFGMERCLRLAHAIRHCTQSTKEHAHPSVDCVMQHLQQCGLDTQRPHLTPNTYDHFSQHLLEIVDEH